LRIADVAAVFLGGGIGSLLRYAVGLAFLQRFGPGFPWGTLAINLAGCLAIGVVAELAQSRAVGLTYGTRVFLTVGVLGGFTTFSTFAYDALTLANEAFTLPAIAYVLASVLGGILAAFAGVVLVRLAG
jgi:CrcB protein